MADRKKNNTLERLGGLEVSVATAKAHFSSLVSGVQKKRAFVTILRRGVPVARLIPVEDKPFSLYGCMRGTVTELGDIVGPTGEDWSIGEK
jgi:prevent-host-death family protein